MNAQRRQDLDRALEAVKERPTEAHTHRMYARVHDAMGNPEMALASRRLAVSAQQRSDNQ